MYPIVIIVRFLFTKLQWFKDRQHFSVWKLLSGSINITKVEARFAVNRATNALQFKKVCETSWKFVQLPEFSFRAYKRPFVTTKLAGVSFLRFWLLFEAIDNADNMFRSCTSLVCDTMLRVLYERTRIGDFDDWWENVWSKLVMFYAWWACWS